ncbi:MAG: glycogen debranching enzyme N-terminal domain-containing protein [Chloroflexota bacterium]|nr:glycogen debranching enzyme N-terminal domain-containing protein [Chloroflexota bacterium]
MGLGPSWEEGLEREWLVTDGRGGYAAGTVAGPHTRRYHGLLVAPLHPPLGRTVLLARLEETLTVVGEAYALSVNEFQDGTIHPQGYHYLTDFSDEAGVPTWRYAAGGVHLQKQVWMGRDESTTFVRYTLTGPLSGAPSGALTGAASARLTLIPLCTYRNFHQEMAGDEDWRFGVERRPGGLTVRPYAGATPYHLLLVPPAGREWTHGGHAGWWWRFLHRAERDRGLDCVEDLYAAGVVGCDLALGESLLVAATLDATTLERAAAEGTTDDSAGRSSLVGPPLQGTAGTQGTPGTHERSRAGLEPADAVPLAEDAFATQLRRAAGQLLVTPISPITPITPGELTTMGADGAVASRAVLAGYYWFGEWGRDTMIALPGLAQATGRYDVAEAILRRLARFVDKGMLPNRFPETGTALGDQHYNTVDATLWYFHAVDCIDRHTDSGLVEALLPVLAEIVDWHIWGTRYGIRVDPQDGLLRVEQAQLTWMDAKVEDRAVTPRTGKPVEVAALWHHALALMEGWCQRTGQGGQARYYADLRQQAAAGFAARYWYNAGGYLYDVVDGPGGDDPSLRPNQVVAAALADCPLSESQRRSVVDVVATRLWTPRGVRSLAREDPRYQGRYGGDPRRRDEAYHQGTVWPWLLGPLVDAALLVHDDRAVARRFLEPLRGHLHQEAGVGTISEVFDGDPPHTPGGCIAQAWSVAEVFRAWIATAG